MAITAMETEQVRNGGGVSMLVSDEEAEKIRILKAAGFLVDDNNYNIYDGHQPQPVKIGDIGLSGAVNVSYDHHYDAKVPDRLREVCQRQGWRVVESCNEKTHSRIKNDATTLTAIAKRLGVKVE
jgi:hypothetical protein